MLARQGHILFMFVIGLLGSALPSMAGTNVTASASDVDSFLGGKTGRLVFVDSNESGKCYWIELSDMLVHELSADADCQEPLIAADGTRVVYGLYNIISKYPGQSQDNEGDAYIRSFSGGNRTHVAGPSVTGRQAFSPHWWKDPNNGDEYIVSMDYYEKDPQNASGRATWKQMIANNQPAGNPVKILDHAFDGGLSKDGKRIAEGYHYTHMASTLDLGGGDGSTISARMDGGNQCCNASMSPDDNYYIMHLRIDHEGCNIRDENDNLVNTIWKPDGAEEMQKPEFSNHPDFSTFTAMFGSNYYMYLANTQTGAILKIAEGNFSVPALWVASEIPTLALIAESLSFSAVEGGQNPESKSVTVMNTGQGTLNAVEISNDAVWLVVTAAGSGNNQTLSNAVDVTGLGPNTYTASVEVSCADADDSPQSYSVILEVAGAGDDVDPTISITTPTPNQTLAGSIPVAGTAADNVAVDQVEVKIDDGAYETASGTTDWNYSLTTTSLADGSHTLTARATDTSGNLATTSVLIEVDNQSSEPSITIISPTGGEIWEVGTTQHIRWSTVGIDDVTIRYSTDNGASWELIEITVDRSKPEWLNYSWLIPDEPSTECLVYISGYFGEVPTQSANNFEIRSAEDDEDEEIVISGGCACGSTDLAGSSLLALLLIISLLTRRRGRRFFQFFQFFQ